MKFQSVILEVLPPYNREQYEKSAIAPLCFLHNDEEVPKTKIPPPVHPKPTLKTIHLSGAGSLDAGVQATLQAKSPNLPRLGRKPSSPSLSPLMGFGNKKNAKKIKIDLKKGKSLEMFFSVALILHLLTELVMLNVQASYFWFKSSKTSKRLTVMFSMVSFPINFRSIISIH